jgi:hypothetical protein
MGGANHIFVMDLRISDVTLWRFDLIDPIASILIHPIIALGWRLFSASCCTHPWRENR